jgi:Holliday junction resolvase RusA-like endonuclease
MEKKIVHLELSGPIPPSYNHAFKRDRFGKDVPTEEHVRWRKEFMQTVLETTPQANLLQFSHISVAERFVIQTTVFMNLINTGYPKTAKTYLKKVDADNRGKLVQDLVCQLLGFDDSHIFESTQVKCHDPDNPHVEVILEGTIEVYGLPRSTWLFGGC